MRLPRVSGYAALLVTLAIVPLTFTCAGEEGLGPEADPLIGNWDATTFVVDGSDLIADGAAIFFSFFDDGGYFFSVNNETSGLLCEGVASCTDEGDFDVVGGTIVFDPGTVDEVSLSFTISGNTLTVSGSIVGFSLSATFVRSV
jgi:hypothetical protein